MRFPSRSCAGLGLTFFLAACNSPSIPEVTPPPPGLPNPPPLAGTLIEGQIIGLASPSSLAVLANADGESATNVGSITKQNVLSMTLNKAPESTSLFSLVPPGSCTFDGTSTANPDIAFYSRLEVYTPQWERMGAIRQRILKGGSLNESVVARVYATEPVIAKAKITCANDFVLIYDMTLNAGWNAVEYNKTGNTNTMVTLNPQATTELTAVPREPAVVVSLSPRDLQFQEDGTATAKASFYQHGGYFGPVSLHTDRDDLTVTPSTVTIPALTAQRTPSPWHFSAMSPMGLGQLKYETTLTFNYSGPGTPGLAFRLAVKDPRGQDVGSGYGQVISKKPAVSARLHGYGYFVCEGETLNVNLTVTSVNGFKGQTRIGMANLPAGVTAPDVQVEVSPDLPTTTSIPVTVQSGAALTNTEVELTSPDLTQIGTDQRVEFGVCPARTAISRQSTGGLAIQGVGGNGLWVRIGLSPLTLLAPGAAPVTAVVPSYHRGISLPDGDMLIPPNYEDSYENYRLTPAGEYTTIASPMMYRNPHRHGAADHLGRIWYAGWDQKLHRWTPETGDEVSFDTPHQYDQEYGYFVASPDGRTLVYYERMMMGKPFVVINADTATVEKRTPQAYLWGNSAAVGNAGIIWFGSQLDYGPLYRIGDAGVVQEISEPSDLAKNVSFLGVDQAGTGNIWVRSRKSVFLINDQGEIVREWPMGSFDGMPLRGGGLAVLSYESADSDPQIYITYLK